MDSDQIRVRTVTPEDAARLLEIYRPYVEKTAITFEYDVPTEEDFRRRIEKTLERYPYIAAVRKEEGQGERILGYAYLGPFKERAAYDWAAEVSIYIDENCRGMGLGKLLYRNLEGISRKMNLINLEACIAYPRQDDEYLTQNSVQFHAHLGFRFVGQFYQCGCKFGRWYDMVWMEKCISDHPDRPQAVIPFSALC